MNAKEQSTFWKYFFYFVSFCAGIMVMYILCLGTAQAQPYAIAGTSDTSFKGVAVDGIWEQQGFQRDTEFNQSSYLFGVGYQFNDTWSGEILVRKAHYDVSLSAVWDDSYVLYGADAPDRTLFIDGSGEVKLLSLTAVVNGKHFYGRAGVVFYNHQFIVFSNNAANVAHRFRERIEFNEHGASLETGLGLKAKLDSGITVRGEMIYNPNIIGSAEMPVNRLVTYSIQAVVPF